MQSIALPYIYGIIITIIINNTIIIIIIITVTITIIIIFRATSKCSPKATQTVLIVTNTYRSIGEQDSNNTDSNKILHCFDGLHFFVTKRPGGGTPYIRMIGMIVVIFRSFNRRLSHFLGVVQAKSIKNIKSVFVRV